MTFFYLLPTEESIFGFLPYKMKRKVIRFHFKVTLISMNRKGKCPKCGGGNVAGPHRVHGGDGAYVKIDLPGFSTATLESFTCADCGYTELYSDRGGLKNIQSSGRFRTQTTQHERNTCSICGTRLHAGSNRCPECGYNMN